MHALFFRSSTVPYKREEKKQEETSIYKDIYRNAMVALKERVNDMTLAQAYIASLARLWERMHLVHTRYIA